MSKWVLLSASPSIACVQQSVTAPTPTCSHPHRERSQRSRKESEVAEKPKSEKCTGRNLPPVGGLK